MPGIAGRTRDAPIEVIPLEALGLEPDLRHQTLRILPTESTETYLTILQEISGTIALNYHPQRSPQSFNDLSAQGIWQIGVHSCY